jgi:hypothetical protein
MAEIGLVHFARVARGVAEAALPRYRETEGRLAEHQELRDALGLARVPDYRRGIFGRLSLAYPFQTLNERVTQFVRNLQTPRHGFRVCLCA